MKGIRKPHRKPTGKIGAHSLELVPGEEAKIRPLGVFKLPEDKNAAETVVMRKLTSLGHESQMLPIVSFSKFPTDHGPDFSIKLVDGVEGYAELLEIAPLRKASYEHAPRVTNVGDYIDFVVEQVSEKNRKYLNKAYKPLCLVLYVSEERFSPGQIETAALRQALNVKNFSAFSVIYLVLFAYDGSPFGLLMAPFKLPYSRNEMKAIRKRQMVRHDLAQAEVLDTVWDGNKFSTTVRVVLPKGIDTSKLRIGENLKDHELNVDLRPVFPKSRT